jgi:hypothetical protein
MKTKETSRKVYDNGFGDYYYKCQKCTSEDVRQQNDGSFSPPDLFCNKCGTKVINKPISVKKPSRELALKWWNNQHFSAQEFLGDKYFYGRIVSFLTGGEIENIWCAEINQVTEEVFPKLNKKQFKVGDTVKCLTDIEFADGSFHYKNQNYLVVEETEAYFNVNSKDYVLVSNSKQFKDFNPDLFLAYINKFSERDKVTALRIFFKSIGITDKEKLEHYLTRY